MVADRRTSTASSGSRRPSSTGAAVASPEEWLVMLDTSLLTAGSHFSLCLDLDGIFGDQFSMHDSGLQLYVSGVSRVQPKALQPCTGPACGHDYVAPGNGNQIQPLRVRCAACSSHSVAFLLHSDATSSCHALPEISGSFVENGTNEAAHTRASFSRHFIGNITPLVGLAPDFDLAIDVRPLQVGLVFKLCIDIDGLSGPLLPGDSASVYISPSSRLISSAFARATTAQRHQLECASCIQSSTVLLASVCESRAVVYPGRRPGGFVMDTQRSSVALLVRESSDDIAVVSSQARINARWLANRQAQELSALRMTMVMPGCQTDAGSSWSTPDGLRTGCHFAARGVHIEENFKTPATTSRASDAQVMRRFSCGDLGRGWEANGYGNDHPNHVCGARPGCRVLTYATAKLHCESLGLRLCSLSEVTTFLPGFGSGCSGFEDMSQWTSDECSGGHRTLNPDLWNKLSSSNPARCAQSKNGHQSSCVAGCSTDNSVHAVLCCADGPGKAPGIVRSQRHSLVIIDSSLPRWGADLDLTGLAEGTSFRICVDLDGEGNEFTAGDTGLSVFVTPAQDVQTRSLRRTTAEQVNLLCASCRPGLATVRLAASCDEPPSAKGGDSSRPAALFQDRLVHQATSRIAILDLAGLVVGAVYHLCIDLDGVDSVFQEGMIGEIVINPIADLRPSSVRRGTAERFTLQCDGCSEVSLLFFGTVCDRKDATATAQTDATEPRGLMRAPPPDDRRERPPSRAGRDSDIGVLGIGDWFTSVVDTSPLLVGLDYSVCLDLDGIAGPLQIVDTGLFVRITAIFDLAASSVLPTAKQRLEFRCEGGSCNHGTIAFLGKHCDSAPDARGGGKGTASVPVAYVRSAAPRSALASRDDGMPWYDALFNAAQLTPGDTFRLCVDFDGPGPMTIGETGLEVLVSPFACGNHGISISADRNQAFDVSCVARSTEICARALAYLGLSCSAPSAEQTKGGAFATPRTLAVAMQASTAGGISPPTWQFLFDARGLHQGSVYRLCLDPDGSEGPVGFIDTGCWAYVSGAFAISPRIVVSDSGEQLFVVHCQEALPTAAGSAPLAGCQHGSTAALCMSGTTALSGGEDFRRTQLAALVNIGFGKWQAKMSTAGLPTGTYLQLCVDPDGFSGSRPLVSTGSTVFVTADITAEPLAIPTESGVIMRITCRNHCSSATHVFLAVSCWPRGLDAFEDAAYETSLTLVPNNRRAAKDHQERTPVAILRPEPGRPLGYWLATFDARSLPAGSAARLCVSYEHEAQIMKAGTEWRAGDRVGDSGVGVYITGVTNLGRYSIPWGPRETLQVTCASGCSSGSVEAFLASECVAQEERVARLGLSPPPAAIAAATFGFGGIDVSARPGRSDGSISSAALLRGIAPAYEVHFDTRALSIGKDYRLCLDHDGAKGTMKPTDSGLHVHVSAVSLSEHAQLSSAAKNVAVVQPAAGQELLLDCVSGCSAASRVFLLLETTTNGGVAASCAAATPGAVLQTGLQPAGGRARGSAKGGIGGGLPGSSAWRATFDASAIPVGRYRVCIDLDGPMGLAFAAGDSGVLIDVILTV
eukprot:TRINITY_DN61878_c0_g1_i1.p1 TRINITY_DN61878_c0_g1~~TRINITY_DN61878_c0_g1_i1.p1  ORF type:complete len:1629 (-),score=201.94 TRINITY_DN61878_c0_g1_i1:91-4779(-)